MARHLLLLFGDFTMDINPDGIPTVTFNIMNRNAKQEFVRSICECRGYLANGGSVGPFKVCGLNPKSPVFKLTIQAKGDGHNLEASFIVYTGNAYIFWFFAGGKWRRFSDSVASVNVLGSVRVSDTSSYSGAPDYISPGAIYNALIALRSDKAQTWKKHVLDIAFMFMESARFNRVLKFTARTFHFCERQRENKTTFNLLVPTHVEKCRNHWGHLSHAMYLFFGAQHYNKSSSNESCAESSSTPRPNQKLYEWDLLPRTVLDLLLPARGDSVVAGVNMPRDLKEQIAEGIRTIYLLCPPNEAKKC